MAWGAAATGTPAATGSTGQGLSLMQESLAEITLARLPLVVLNMARAPGRLLPGHPRAAATATTATSCWPRPTSAEAVELIQLAFHLAERRGATRCWSWATTTWPTPPRSVAVARSVRTASRAEWALDGSTAGRAGPSWSRSSGAGQAARRRRLRPRRPLRGLRGRTRPSWLSECRAAGRERPHRRRRRGGRGLRHAGRATSAPPCAIPAGRGCPCRLRPPGHPVPVPLRRRRRRRPAGAKAVAVYENNTGQMIDDVRLAVLGRAPVALHRRPQPGHLGLRHRPRPRRAAARDVGSSTCWSVTRERVVDLPIVPPTDRRARRPGWSTTSRPPLIDVGRPPPLPGVRRARRHAQRRWRRSTSSSSSHRTIAVFGIGCYTAFSNNLDVEVLQALHGRAPSVATGVKRARPDTIVVTVQGDGDMVSEGLQEVLHAAARGENVTCVMLNNGVFGETGGHMTRHHGARAAHQDQPRRPGPALPRPAHPARSTWWPSSTAPPSWHAAR